MKIEMKSGLFYLYKILIFIGIILIGVTITNELYKVLGVTDILAYMDSIENNMPAVFGYLSSNVVCISVAYILIDLFVDFILIVACFTIDLLERKSIRRTKERMKVEMELSDDEEKRRN